MDSIAFVSFICIVIPMALSLLLLEKKSRLTVIFMIIGIVVCLLSSQINSILLDIYGDENLVSTTYAPVVEEILKALPVIYYAFLFKSDRRTLLTVSFAVGVGFAVFENILILLPNASGTSFLWAVFRGFGASLMHGLCTCIVGQMLYHVKKSKKLFLSGTFGLLSIAIIYHSIYNTLILSDLEAVGLALPVLTYIPLVIITYKYRRITNESD